MDSLTRVSADALFQSITPSMSGGAADTQNAKVGFECARVVTVSGRKTTNLKIRTDSLSVPLQGCAKG